MMITVETPDIRATGSVLEEAGEMQEKGEMVEQAPGVAFGGL